MLKINVRVFRQLKEILEALHTEVKITLNILKTNVRIVQLKEILGSFTYSSKNYIEQY